MVEDDGSDVPVEGQRGSALGRLGMSALGTGQVAASEKSPADQQHQSDGSQPGAANAPPALGEDSRFPRHFHVFSGPRNDQLVETCSSRPAEPSE